jgi:hypothetical protein
LSFQNYSLHASLAYAIRILAKTNKQGTICLGDRHFLLYYLNIRVIDRRRPYIKTTVDWHTIPCTLHEAGRNSLIKYLIHVQFADSFIFSCLRCWMQSITGFRFPMQSSIRKLEGEFCLGVGDGPWSLRLLLKFAR